jgi:hypothetical protein
VRFSSAALVLVLVSLAPFIVCQEQQAPRRYEQQSMAWLEIKKGLTGPDAGDVKAFTREPFMLTLEVRTVNRVVRSDDPRNSIP